MAAIKLQRLEFAYRDEIPILNVPFLQVEPGESVFLYGPSGCGKTTLMGLVAGILPSRTGQVSVLGQDMSQLSGVQKDKFRARSIGYIFQVFNLVPYLSVFENILLPTLFGRERSGGFDSFEDEIASLIKQLGIAELKDRSVLELSIGQQQRVAAARALLGSPGLILADEPTSALDADSRLDFIEALFAQATREKSSILFVSHDRSLEKRFNRTLSLVELNHVLRGDG
ncbi:MAG: ABC transporter ATP-binding protein [Proteobacteria bacterium]|nr:ABC transporter ATP-binding protein [Pseudomonadota bacterium]